MLPNLRAGLIFLLGCTVFAGPQEVADHGQKFTVFVYNDAEVPEQLLSAAEQDAGAVFAEAGLQAAWVNCMPAKRAMTRPECSQPPAPAQLVVRLVPRSLTLGDTAFGVAFLSNEGGTFADVFFDPFRRLRAEGTREISASLLGHVMTHEIGHLLLGSNRHSRLGIMQARWHSDQLRSIAVGGLWFMPEQAAQMRARVSSLSKADSRPEMVADARH